ncbi:DNA primase [Streptomyces sp. NBC_00878]|uniref:DNA primase n=1 Tax=Streptomyces sp. NBC_00878 TaxID=2975854 RepID=UPI002251667A|nr:DNA primase [Streptomyces sp. NBC_00878]MCX4909601.1 DNA primase [Streptomyces sp. NBC_00878]
MGRRDIAALKAAVPLKDVITDYVPLRKSGREFRGSCPFCEGSSGQFSVNSHKGAYHCFECQVGGDALDFIMRMEHLSFGEAVDRLASRGGITLRADAGHRDRQHVERIRLVEAHRAATQFYFTQLDTSTEAAIGRTFLAERGIDQAAAEQFSVGYSPQGWDHLTRYLRGKGFTDKELLLSGLAQEGRRGPIDRFRGRLMWPIRNIGGEAVGFGARKLYEADTGPKYINTPDTPIYMKSQALFGIDLAKKNIAKTNRAIVVEGYTDVMACHLAGIPTAVATCGTPFGTDHITILRRLLKSDGSARITFAFAHDGHAHQSALRTLKDDQKLAGHSYVAVAPDGMSASALRIAKGDAAVMELVEPRTPLFEFVLRQIVARHDMETTTGQKAALAEAAPIVARITDSTAQHHVALGLASMLDNLDENLVVRHIRQLARETHGSASRTSAAEHPPTYANAETPPKPVINLRNAVYATERELLKIALQRPGLVSPAFDAYGIEEFTAVPYAAVRRAITDAGGAEYGVQDPQEYLSLVREAAPDDAVRALITELTTEPIMRRNVDEAYAGDQLVTVRRRSVDRRMQDLLGVLARESDQKDSSRSTAVQNEVWVLQQYGQALRERGVEAL